ncbi:NUDIX domain-containing protein [Candidatus Saccharibacteria bacterium]|nr:NUDIX domain-containing protein [Candidatus Saccharibacteria bacterium]
MAHIHAEPGQHDITVNMFIVHIEDGKSKILLNRHKKLNKLMCVGGHMELDETPWHAVLREICEETGYEINQLKVLQSAPNLEQNPNSNATYWPIPITVQSHRYGSENHFHDTLDYAFLTTELPNGEPDEGESREFHWLDLAEMSALSDDETVANSRETSKFILENFTNWRAEEISKFGGTQWQN